MKRLLLGLAVLPFVAGVALAQDPVKLTGQQMDKVTAGWDLMETDVSNTSVTVIGIYENQFAANSLGGCPGKACYLQISSPAFQITSYFGP